jgi:hypothetical protein
MIIILKVLNSIETATSIMLTLKQTEKNVDFYLINEKLNQINLPANQLTLIEIENILKKVRELRKNRENRNE